MVSMAVLLDQNVDDRVADIFGRAGHSVALVRNLLGARATDKLVAFTACDQGLVVVTHDRDYRRFHQLIAFGAHNKFSLGAGRISLGVTEPRAAVVIQEHMEEIEFYYARAIASRQRLL